MATNKIKATVINLEQEVPKSGGSPWLMISEKAAAAAMSSERPGLVAGSAQSLVGPKVSTGPAVALAAPATGAAILDTIKGRTLVWNQLVQPTSFSTIYLTDNSGLFKNNGDGTYTITTTGTTANTLVTGEPVAVPVGHKILVKFGNTAGGYITMRINGSSNISQDTIYTATNAGVYPRIASGLAAGTYDTSFNIIDLTAMFGAGNEPATVAEFKALFPDDYYATNPGTLLPLRISGLVSKYADDAELATLSLPIIGKTAKDGDGNPIVPFPDGMHGTPTDYDTATKAGGEVKWGVRAYEAGDESDATVITDGTNTAYPLATPVPFTWDEPLEMVAPVADGGVLFLQPEGVDEQGIPATAPLAADIKWPVNAVSADTLTNLLDALKTAGVITAYTMTWDAAAGAYTFTIS